MAHFSIKNWLVLLLILLTPWSMGYTVAICTKSAGGGPPACTQEEVINNTGTDQDSCCDISSTTYCGFQWTAGDSYSQTQVKMYLNDVGAPSMNVKVHTYSDSSNNPSSSLASTDWIAASSLTRPGLNTFTFTGSATINSSSKYWTVIQCSAVNASNYITNYRNAAGSAGPLKVDADGVGTWFEIDAACDGRFETYSGSCP